MRRKIFIVLLISIVIIILCLSINKIKEKQKIEFEYIYGYCPNDRYADVVTSIIKDVKDLNEKLLKTIYINKEWSFINDEWEQGNNEIMKNTTVKEYFNEEFFEKYNIIVFTYSLYNDDYKSVETIKIENNVAHLSMQYYDVYGGPYDWSNGYCFIIIDKNITEFKINY